MQRNILVIRLGALGDIFLTMNVLQAIRVHHARDRITFFTRPQFADLARKMPWFDEVWTDPKPKPWQVTKWLALRRRLLQGNFARIYDLQCNSRTGWYFHLLGFNPPEWVGAARGCSHPRPESATKRIHADEIWSQLIASAGVPRAGRADLSWLDGPLNEFKLPNRFVVLVPGCVAHRPKKRWPASAYAQLAHRLAKNGLGVAMVGTAADHESVDAIMKLAPFVVNLAGQTDIGQLAALARRAVAVVGNDTGPMHVMAMAGAPTLVLMSSESDPVVIRPNGPKVGWLQRESLTELGVEEVWNELTTRWSLSLAQDGPATPQPVAQPPP